MRFAIAPILLGSALLLTACGDKPLHNLDARRQGPDEFLVLPNKPLEAPANYAELPTPTPGGANRTDRNPQSEAIVALGDVSLTVSPRPKAHWSLQQAAMASRATFARH